MARVSSTCGIFMYSSWIAAPGSCTAARWRANGWRRNHMVKAVKNSRNTRQRHRLSLVKAVGNRKQRHCLSPEGAVGNGRQCILPGNRRPAGRSSFRGACRRRPPSPPRRCRTSRAAPVRARSAACCLADRRHFSWRLLARGCPRPPRRPPRARLPAGGPHLRTPGRTEHGTQ